MIEDKELQLLVSTIRRDLLKLHHTKSNWDSVIVHINNEFTYTKTLSEEMNYEWLFPLESSVIHLKNGGHVVRDKIDRIEVIYKETVTDKTAVGNTLRTLTNAVRRFKHPSVIIDSFNDHGDLMSIVLLSPEQTASVYNASATGASAKTVDNITYVTYVDYETKLGIIHTVKAITLEVVISVDCRFTITIEY